jgi:PAS domain S-box-containing protein
VAAPIQIDRGDGVIDFYVLLSTSLLDVTGEKLILVCMEDFTELKRAEEELRRSEERYVLAQRAANIGSWDWNILTGDLEWSERIEPMFGFANGEFGATYEAFLECVHPDDRLYVVDSVNAAVEKDADYSIEHRIVWPDGTVRWVSEDGDVFRDEGGNPVRMLGIVQDITERKQAEDHIEYLNHLLLSIKDIGQIISHESNLKKLLSEVCNLLLETRNYIDVAFSILDDEKQLLVLIEHRGEHQRKMREIALYREDEVPVCVQTVLKTGSRIIINSTVEHCAGCQYCGHDSDHQTILIPMAYEKSIVGLMTVCLKAQHKFDEMEINLLEEIAEDLAFAHAKIKSDEALRKARDELERRVHERTAELVKANEALQAEIAERLHYQSQLRSLASELSLAEERERRRIATELHDNIVQTLAVSKIKLSALREVGSSVEFSEPLQNILELLNQAIQDTRSLTFELSPPILYELGFVPAVEWLAEKYEKQHNILTKVEDDRLLKPLDADVRIVLFQTVRELLNNVVKHARAKKVEICIKRMKSNIQVHVEDDGVGFDISETHLRMENSSGFGLFNIRERLDHLGGHFEIKSNKGQGTRVILHAPLKQNGEDTE